MKSVLLALTTMAMMAMTTAKEEEMPMIQTAMEFMARASTTSEVLTLNLTNLLILLVLKALIFGFGLFSAGGTGRALDEDASTWITPAEITGGMCFMMFTAGAEDKMDCIQRTGCEAPEKMKEWLVGGDLWYQAHKYFRTMVPFEEKYQRLYHKLAEGIEDGLQSLDCSSKYSW